MSASAEIDVTKLNCLNMVRFGISKRIHDELDSLKGLRRSSNFRNLYVNIFFFCFYIAGMKICSQDINTVSSVLKQVP